MEGKKEDENKKQDPLVESYGNYLLKEYGIDLERTKQLNTGEQDGTTIKNAANRQPFEKSENIFRRAGNFKENR